MNLEPVRTPLHGHFAEVNGIQMYYEIHGEGSPLVLLHGFTQSAQAWQPFIAEFARYFRLIIPDLRAHGHSSGPITPLMARQAASDMFALLDHLQIERFIAAGISYGGSILLHQATQQSARVEAMVLIGGAPYFPAQVRKFYRKRTPDSEAWDWGLLRSQHVHGDEQIQALLHYLHNLKDSYDDMNLTASHLSTIQAKTLIVAGDRDHLFPMAIPVEMYQAIPNAYLWIVPNGGHVPIMGERADAFTQTALAFLNGNWQ